MLTEDDLSETLSALSANNGHYKKTAHQLGITDRQLRRRLRRVEQVSGVRREKFAPAVPKTPENAPPLFPVPPIGSSKYAAKWEIKSLPDNTFRFATFGDLHAGSKYCRWDVREDLTRRAEKFKAQAILDTGNWIDGLKPFNLHDLEAIGLEQQCQLLARRYPKTKLPTYAVTGADHEGWFVRSEGVDVGKYCEGVMREHGHPWTNLGYMEADIVLRNANNEKSSCILRVMHPGGGSAYALSYKPQKTIESFEGGEKPAVLLMGHYHKLDCGLIRNVFYVQTGTCQDQTPFLRQHAIECHVGGVLVEMEQDPKTGAIISFTPTIRRYFNEAYYFDEGRANNRWSGHGPITQVPRS